MSLIPVISDEEASPEVQALFKNIKKIYGRVANAIRVAAHTPRIAQVLFGFIVASQRSEISGSLTKRVKGLITLKTSLLNGCNYWISHKTTLGRGLGFSDELIQAVNGDYLASNLFSSEEKAALRWAEIVTLKLYHSEPGRPSQSPEAMAELKNYYTSEQIVELTIVIGHNNFWNRFTDSLEIDMESDELQDKFKKSTNVDIEDYTNFMKDCWWNR
jgi:AhpD family alkylhydroperoxidase